MYARDLGAKYSSLLFLSAFIGYISNNFIRFILSVNQSIKCLDQGRPGHLEFGMMKQRELPQHLFTLRSEPDEHAPLILIVATALDKATLYHTINQLDRTVMLNLEPFGQLADGSFSPRGQSLEREKQLMLLRLKASLASTLLAEMQKAPNLIAKFG